MARKMASRRPCARAEILLEQLSESKKTSTNVKQRKTKAIVMIPVIVACAKYKPDVQEGLVSLHKLAVIVGPQEKPAIRAVRRFMKASLVEKDAMAASIFNGQSTTKRFVAKEKTQKEKRARNSVTHAIATQ